MISKNAHNAVAFRISKIYNKFKINGRQARNQLGKPEGAKSFLRGAQIC